MSLDGDIIAIYNDEIIALSEKTREAKHLAHPDLSARAVSPICGSEVTVELKIDSGTITDIGYEVEACALTRAAVAVLAEAVPGKTRAEVAAAGAEMRAMLESGGARPSGAFSRLSLLAPVKDYPSRHNALLLPFEAVEKAFKSGPETAAP